MPVNQSTPRMSKLLGQMIFLLCGGLLFFAIQQIGGWSTGNTATSSVSAASIVAQDAINATYVMNYQGRLLEPTTGAAKPDGVYPMTFRLYNVATGGEALWSETKNVSVSQGRFTTLLGDTTSLAISLFNGQERWLGVQVGTDLEATPRQRVAYSAYAFFSETTRNADLLDGQDASAFAGAGHGHDGAALVSGVVSDDRLAPEMTRDNEVLPILQANDGAGSSVDADLLDGNDSSAFAGVGHNHQGSYFNRIRGTQFSATLAPGQSNTWFTHSWATDEVVVWGVYPISPAGRVSYSVETELEQSGGVGNGLIKYYIRVTNVGAVNVTFEARWVAFR